MPNKKDTLGLKHNIENKGGSTFSQPMDIRLPDPVSDLLTKASQLLEDLEQQIKSATDPHQIKQSLYAIRQVRELQKNAIRGILSFHEEALSKALSDYDARIDTVQRRIITDDSLPEETKSSILVDSANTLKKDKHAISHVKHAVQDFQVQIQNLSTARETISDTIDRYTLDLDNAPVQPDKLPVVKAFADSLLQAEKCLFTVIRNELGRGHYDIAVSYNNNDVGQTKPLPATSFYQGSHFQVPPLTHSLLEESKAYIEKSEKLDKQHHITASSLLSHMEVTLQEQKSTISHLGKSGELHFKEFQTNIKSTLINGIKRIGHLITDLRNTQSSLALNTPEFTTAVVSVLRATYALEKVGSYANELQSSHPHHHILTKQKEKTMQQLLSHYKTALMDSEAITSAAVCSSSYPRNTAFNSITTAGKKCAIAVVSFFSSFFSRSASPEMTKLTKKDSLYLEPDSRKRSRFMNRQTSVSSPVIPNDVAKTLVQEAKNPFGGYTDTYDINSNSNQKISSADTHSSRIQHERNLVKTGKKNFHR